MSKSLMRRIHAFIMIMVAPLASLQAFGQDDVETSTLQIVDQTVADVSDLSASLRAIDPGLSRPSGFDRVYRVPGNDDLVMRANGGLYAVFPHSRYDFGPAGPVAVVPDGTVFYIGAPPTPVEPSRGVGGMGDEIAHEP